MVGQHEIGKGLSRFVFEFLMDETSRSFNKKLPMDKQARAALLALEDFDSVLAKRYKDVLVGLQRCKSSDGGDESADKDDSRGFLHTIGDFLPDCTDEEEPVTAENVAEVIVAACKYKLWDQREAQLLALRKGFGMRQLTHEIVSCLPSGLSCRIAPTPTHPKLEVIQHTLYE